MKYKRISYGFARKIKVQINLIIISLISNNFLSDNWHSLLERKPCSSILFSQVYGCVMSIRLFTFFNTHV